MQPVRIAWRGGKLLTHLLLGMLLTPLVTRRDDDGYWHVHHGTAAWWHGRLTRILRLQITTSGATPQPATLVVCNHISWLDIIVLGHLMPTCFLSKSEVRRWPLIGWLAMRTGTLFIRRGGGEANHISQTIGRHLLHEGILTLFPEGTTTDGRQVRPFFSRLLAAAIETRTPLTPVAIRYHLDGRLDDQIAPYTDDQSLGENILGLLSRPGGAVHVHFAAPIQAHGLQRKKLADQARAAIVEALAQTGIE